MEPAIERYLERSSISWDVGTTMPSGLRTYVIPVADKAAGEAIVAGFDEPLVSDAPSLTHLFWAYDEGGSWKCGANQQHVRRGRPDDAILSPQAVTGPQSGQLPKRRRRLK